MEDIKKFLKEGKAVCAELVEKTGFCFVEAFDKEDIEEYLKNNCQSFYKRLCVLVKVNDFDDAGDGVALFLPDEFKEKYYRNEHDFKSVYFKMANAFLKAFSDVEVGISRIELLNGKNKGSLVIGFVTNGIEPVLDFIEPAEELSIHIVDYYTDLKLSEDTIEILMAQKLNKVSFVDFYKYVSERVIGQDLSVRIGCYSIYNYWRSIANGDVRHINILMIGPSGCGKTEFVRAITEFIREYDIPITINRSDMTQITANGYKGDDSHVIIDGLLDKNKSLHGFGICVIDEFDKRIRPSRDTRGNDQNDECQNQILTMIEGNEFELDEGRFDSNRTLFLCIGAFQDIRNERESERNSRKSGFLHTEATESEKYFYSMISADDLIDYGMKEELVGRFNLEISFSRIEEKMMEKIIIKRTNEIAEELNIEVALSKKAISDIYELSYGPCGVRMPINHIRQMCYEVMADKALLTDGVAKHNYKIYIEDKDTAKLVNNNKSF